MPQPLTIKVDLSSPVTPQSLLSISRSFLGWWRAELYALLPEAIRKSTKFGLEAPRLIVESNEWQLDGLTDYAGSISLDSAVPPYEHRETIARITHHTYRSGVDVFLPKDAALVRLVQFPAAAAKHLRSVVRLQLDRFSPFRGDDVYFDCRVVVPNEITNRTAGNIGDLPVEIAIIPKQYLYEIENKIRQAGLVPRKFCISQSSHVFPPVGLPWTSKTLSQSLLLAAGLILWGMAIALAPGTQDDEVQALRSKIELATPAARHALAARRELTKYKLPPEALSGERMLALDVIADLTKQLPQSVHITSLHLSESLFRLSGTAPKSVGVERRLKNLRHFLVVSVSYGVGAPDAFQLTAKIRR